MKKSLLALAVLASFASAASAQSSVTMYGLVDAGIVSERGGKAGNITKLTSGIGSQSRLGFRGTEDLGNGLSALFVLETGVKIDLAEARFMASMMINNSIRSSLTLVLQVWMTTQDEPRTFSSIRV